MLIFAIGCLNLGGRSVDLQRDRPKTLPLLGLLDRVIADPETSSFPADCVSTAPEGLLQFVELFRPYEPNQKT